VFFVVDLILNVLAVTRAFDEGSGIKYVILNSILQNRGIEFTRETMVNKAARQEPKDCQVAFG